MHKRVHRGFLIWSYDLNLRQVMSHCQGSRSEGGGTVLRIVVCCSGRLPIVNEKELFENEAKMDKSIIYYLNTILQDGKGVS